MRCPLCDAPESWSERFKVAGRIFCGGCGHIYHHTTDGTCTGYERTNHVPSAPRTIKPEMRHLAIMDRPALVTVGIKHYGQWRVMEIPADGLKEALKRGWIEWHDAPEPVSRPAAYFGPTAPVKTMDMTLLARVQQRIDNIDRAQDFGDTSIDDGRYEP